MRPPEGRTGSEATIVPAEENDKPQRKKEFDRHADRGYRPAFDSSEDAPSQPGEGSKRVLYRRGPNLTIIDAKKRL
jgi:hypothetical protein